MVIKWSGYLRTQIIAEYIHLQVGLKSHHLGSQPLLYESKAKVSKAEVKEAVVGEPGRLVAI